MTFRFHPPKLELPDLWLPGRQKAAPMDSRRFLQCMGAAKDCCKPPLCADPPWIGTPPSTLQVDVSSPTGETCSTADCEAAFEGTYLLPLVTSGIPSPGNPSGCVRNLCRWRLVIDPQVNVCLGYYWEELYVNLWCCTDYDTWLFTGYSMTIHFQVAIGSRDWGARIALAERPDFSGDWGPFTSSFDFSRPSIARACAGPESVTVSVP